MTPTLREQVALKPCPFCGSADHLSMQATGSMTADMSARPYRVMCSHIDHDDVLGPVGYGRADATLAWNTRAAPALPVLEISTPDMPGQFEGDIWFGDPVKRNLATHRWQSGEWVLLPSELESVLELLAVRTAELDAARRPDGWKLVPVEPTEAMRDAGNEARASFHSFGVNTLETYRAMLSASPPVQGDISSRNGVETTLDAMRRAEIVFPPPRRSK